MRKIIKAFYNPFIQFYFNSQLKTFTKTKKSNSFLVLDIDNTIADTWTNLNGFKKDRNAFFLNLQPLHGTLNYINNHFSNLPVIFISNRNIIDYKVTKKWLIKNGFNMNDNLLIVTNNPIDKIKYLKYLSNNFEIIYFDDLSYNHEKGKPLFFGEVIDEVKKMNLKYYDYQFILNLNSK
ncbi:hypothetical protein [Flavobacterium dankookense]|uniref:Uncharacterized protein n=1 Tax=Flavobacterium dankookense TaxID=706186 RepID=A0A4R6QAE7_9FLAO|nr:hypothetical protein [Flavobacterium dankookense]TDP59195.1 hypothetical protein BC748_1438 [Flavobacterium dankookense]